MSIKVLALVGSLRKASLNKVLVQTAAEQAPAGMEITIFPLNDVPLFDADLEAEGFPDSVEALREAVKNCDAIIFATPEYNGSLSGVLKNGIDWASRGGLLGKKPVVTMGGSPGALGATKAQEHLRAICLHLGMYLMPKPTVAVPHFGKKIEDGKLTDDQTREFIGGQMTAFEEWINRFK